MATGPACNVRACASEGVLPLFVDETADILYRLCAVHSAELKSDVAAYKVVGTAEELVDAALPKEDIYALLRRYRRVEAARAGRQHVQSKYFHNCTSPEQAGHKAIIDQLCTTRDGVVSLLAEHFAMATDSKSETVDCRDRGMVAVTVTPTGSSPARSVTSCRRRRARALRPMKSEREAKRGDEDDDDDAVFIDALMMNMKLAAVELHAADRPARFYLVVDVLERLVAMLADGYILIIPAAGTNMLLFRIRNEDGEYGSLVNTVYVAAPLSHKMLPVTPGTAGIVGMGDVCLVTDAVCLLLHNVRMTADMDKFLRGVMCTRTYPVWLDCTTNAAPVFAPPDVDDDGDATTAALRCAHENSPTPLPLVMASDRMDMVASVRPHYNAIQALRVRDPSVPYLYSVFGPFQALSLAGLREVRRPTPHMLAIPPAIGVPVRIGKTSVFRVKLCSGDQLVEVNNHSVCVVPLPCGADAKKSP